MSGEFIKLTLFDTGNELYVKPETITAIYRDIPAFTDDEATAVCFDGTLLFVAESVNEVVRRIAN